MALEPFSEYPSPQTKNGVHFLTPLYVLIATKFSVGGGPKWSPVALIDYPLDHLQH